MIKLSIENKLFFVGGGKVGRPRLNKNYLFKKSFGFPKSFKEFDDLSYRLGLFSMAAATSAINLKDAFSSENNNYLPVGYGYSGNMYSSGYAKPKLGSSFSSAVRPTIRYGAYAHRGSITFGLPWM